MSNTRQCVLKNHDDLFAGRQIGHIEILKIFKNEIMNPPCYSLIATFFEVVSSEKNVRKECQSVRRDQCVPRRH